MLKKNCCTEPTCSSNQRNRYFQGKRLTPAALETEQAYSLIRRRLINQMIHGTGVVAGFQIQPGEELEIGKGLAIDALGRELIQTEWSKIPFSQLLVIENGEIQLDEQSRPTQNGVDPDSVWLLSAHYAELKIGQTTVENPCSCDRTEWDYLCETIRYSIEPWNEELLQSSECSLKCDCNGLQSPISKSRSACCIDHCVTEREFLSECRLMEVNENCGTVEIDLNNRVALAKVTLKPQACDKVQVKSSETCGIRKLVKHNELLFDLIRGCDLTRIASFSWEKWPREVDFEVFRGMFPILPNSQECVTGFTVKFDRHINTDSIRPEAIVIRVFFVEGFDEWLEGYRVPILKITESAENTLAVVVDKDWVNDALFRNNKFDKGAALIEIEVRGDMIIDCTGQAVDVNRSGTPGGVLLKSHLIQAR